MRVQFDSVVFAYSMEDIFVSGGNRYLRNEKFIIIDEKDGE